MTTAAAENLQTETVVHLPLDQLHKSPSQPRRRGADKLPEDFVASIREQGVIQPIISRIRKLGGWEIVFGHRRWDGSKLAERPTIPSIVRELTDEEVFELQLIENIHREDMHPLDEAYGFKRMMEQGKKTPQQIAERIGRPLTYVAQRLKLADLAKEARDAFDKDKITLGVAVLLARIPPQLQPEALKELCRWDRSPSVHDAKRLLDEKYLMRLDLAPFDIASAELVPKAGACTACPKRTGQQVELFPEAARPDLCFDRVCYRGKLDAVWQIRKKEAAAGGMPVLEGKAAKKALDYGGGFKSLDAEEWTGSGHKKVRAILGKNLPPITLARDPESGNILELVKAKDVDQVQRRNKPAKSSKPSGSAAAEMTRLKNEEAKEERLGAVVDLTIASAVDRIDRMTDDKLIRLLVQAMIGMSFEENEETIRRRGIADGKKVVAAEKAMTAYLKTLTKAADVAGVGLELTLRALAPSRWKKAEPLWGETLKILGVKFEAFEKQVAAEAKMKAKAEADAKKQAKKDAKAKGKPKAKK